MFKALVRVITQYAYHVTETFILRNNFSQEKATWQCVFAQLITHADSFPNIDVSTFIRLQTYLIGINI